MEHEAQYGHDTCQSNQQASSAHVDYLTNEENASQHQIISNQLVTFALLCS